MITALVNTFVYTFVALALQMVLGLPSPSCSIRTARATASCAR